MFDEYHAVTNPIVKNLLVDFILIVVFRPNYGERGSIRAKSNEEQIEKIRTLDLTFYRMIN